MIVEIIVKNKKYIKVIKQSLEEFLDANSDNHKYFLNNTLEVFCRNIIMIIFAKLVKQHSLHDPSVRKPTILIVGWSPSTNKHTNHIDYISFNSI